MPSLQFPVLVCRDAAGLRTAIVVEGAEASGFGSTQADALRQVKEYLEWFFRQPDAVAEGPDFIDPQLTVFRVEVRPETRDDERVYLSDSVVSLRVACVHAQQDGGGYLAVLPLLGVRFVYFEPNQLKEMVQRFAIQALEGKSADDLIRLIPPLEMELNSVNVRVRDKGRGVGRVDDPPTLQLVAESMAERSWRKYGSRAWERETTVSVVVRKLTQERTNVLLVGEPGVGKTTILAEAVQQIERGTAPLAKPKNDSATEDADVATEKNHRRFWLTSAGRLIAGMRYLGQWEARVERVVAELGQIGGVLCVDRLLELVRLGGFEPTDSIAAFLAPYLQRGELRLAAEATPAELDACRRLLPGFADLFQIVLVPAMDRGQSLSVLGRIAENLQQNARVQIQPGTVDRIYHLFRRFAPYHSFPGRAVGFLKQLVEKHSAGKRSTGDLVLVGPEQVINLFVQQTGLPDLFLRDEWTLQKPDVVEHFSARIINQPDACDAAANLVTTFKAGLNDPNRPIGVWLFCGPTGVGKTALARAIAEYFFGSSSQGRDADRLIRLDMSEYAGFDAVERLVGPPHGEPSPLIRQLRQQPFSLVLFDEIEKASPDVFDVLLSVFDEGRLTDRFGRTTTFRGSIILLTSNIGADRQKSLGFGQQSGPRYIDEARTFFRPEFFNRLDGVVTFQPLGADTIQAITRLELHALEQREGLARSNLKLAPTELLVTALAAEGFDARYGARPLQRTMERLVVAPLAQWLLQHPDLRDAVVELDWDDGIQIKLKVIPGP